MDDYEAKDKYGKTPSATSTKRTKWRVYNMMQNSKKGLLLFGFEVVVGVFFCSFFQINVHGHL